MTRRIRHRAIRILKCLLRAFAEGSGARVHAMQHQHPVTFGDPEPAPVPHWHPERVVPLRDLPAAEQQWWRNLEKHVR